MVALKDGTYKLLYAPFLLRFHTTILHSIIGCFAEWASSMVKYFSWELRRNMEYQKYETKTRDGIKDTHCVGRALWVGFIWRKHSVKMLSKICNGYLQVMDGWMPGSTVEKMYYLYISPSSNILNGWGLDSTAIHKNNIFREGFKDKSESGCTKQQFSI